MGLGLYTSADPSTLISDSGDFTNPLLVTLDGKLGGTIQNRIYARNDDNTKSYTGITVLPVDASDPDLIDGTRGISWKLYAGDTQPTEEQWALTSAANTISLPDLGTLLVSNITTYTPFWIRVEIPRSTDVQTIKDIILKVLATEVLV